MYKKIKKKPTKIIVVPHYVGTEKDTKVFNTKILQTSISCQNGVNRRNPRYVIIDNKEDFVNQIY